MIHQPKTTHPLDREQHANLVDTECFYQALHLSFLISSRQCSRSEVGQRGPLLKYSPNLVMTVQLAAFNFIPAKFQSRPSLPPLTFSAPIHPPPHSSPFLFRITRRDCSCAVIFNPGGLGGLVCILEILWRKAKKAAIFCLNIPLTKSIDHPWGSWERGSEMERRVLSSNNSYLHPFLPLRCCVVVGHTSALFLGEPVRLKLFYASAPRAPIWKLCVSVFTRCCHMARSI